MIHHPRLPLLVHDLAVAEPPAEVGRVGALLFPRPACVLGLVGRGPDLYGLYVGGRLAGDRLGDLLADRVPRAEIADVLRPVLSRYAVERLPHESLGDWWQRLSGRTEPRTLLTGSRETFDPTLEGEVLQP